MSDQYREHLERLVASTPIRALLREGEAVVLERLARGGGATNWYYLGNPQALDAVTGRLNPGSVVTFYFDGRVSRLPDADHLQSSAVAVLKRARECVIGAWDAETHEIRVDFVTAPEEVDEFIQEYSAAPVYFAGPFPARESDGRATVTVVLPDADGEVRAHPT